MVNNNVTFGAFFGYYSKSGSEELTLFCTLFIFLVRLTDRC